MSDEERVQAALQDIADGMSERKAAIRHNVGRRKLHSRRSGCQPRDCYLRTVLAKEEEEALVKVVIWADRAGQGWSPKRVKEMAELVLAAREGQS